MMANRASRTAKPEGLLRRPLGLALTGCLLLGLSVTAGAQDTKTKADPKVPAKADPRTDPKATTKAEPKADPKASETTGVKPGFLTVEEPTRIIDETLAKAWKENSLEPAERCDDYEFIRRVTIDIIGRIPTVDELDRFMKDPTNNRRALLVDRLLKVGKFDDKGNLIESSDYAKNWSTIWTHWLMTRTGDRIYREQIKLWLEETLAQENMSYKDMTERLITATGATNENGAVNFVLAHLGGPLPAAKHGEEGAFDMVPITARTARLFLGFQIQCTQCHDHPTNPAWKQPNFWGVNAFFRQVERVGTPPGMRNNQMMVGTPKLELRDNSQFNKTGQIYFEKRNGVYQLGEAKFLNGKKLPKGGQKSRREELAQFIVSHENFGPAYVNRMWAHFFGRGMNAKPAFDDFGEHNELTPLITNLKKQKGGETVEVHLIEALSDHFAGTGAYNPRKMIKWIVSSDAYNLKAVANKTHIKEKVDPDTKVKSFDSSESDPYFCRMSLKIMSPEEMLDSLLTATNPHAGDIKDDEALADAHARLRQQWIGKLVRNFGDDEGNEMSYNGTVVQALLMMNGQDLNQAILANSGTVQHALKIAGSDTTGHKTVDYLFRATLSRPVGDKEFLKIKEKWNLMEKGKAIPPGDKKQWIEAMLQDMFWVLLNCNEFILNH
jgi:hypothetical protein